MSALTGTKMIIARFFGGRLGEKNAILDGWRGKGHSISRMKRARQALMVALMATALCADRGAVVAPTGVAGGGQAGELADMAGRFVGRLAAGFVRSRVSANVPMERNAGRPDLVIDSGVCAVERGETPRGECWSPFQFRLPPPGVC